MCLALASRECVVTGNLGKVAGIVESEDAYVVAASNLKTVDAAVGSHDPGSLFGVRPDRAHQMQRKKADRTGVRKYRDPGPDVISKNVPKLARAAAKKVRIAFAVGYHMLDVAVYERVVIVGKGFFRFVECKTFEHAYVPFPKRIGRIDRNPGQSRKRLRRLNGSRKVA